MAASEFARLLPAPPTATAEWGAFSLHVIDRRESIHNTTLAFADHLLTWQIAGTCRLRREADGRSVQGSSGPGAVNIVPANFTATWDCAGASRNIDLHIPGAFLARVAEDCGIESQKLEIIPQFLIHDPVIEGVLTHLGIEARNGSPSGQLYAESACEFLAHHVIHAYSSRSRPLPHAIGGLSGRRLRAVLDYIEERLAEPIALRQLAELAQVSQRHFERAFRQAMGVPPHTYVMQKRVAAAQHLLVVEPTRAIEDIAARVGFSSSSHLAYAFRRHTGHSPAAFRRAHSTR